MPSLHVYVFVHTDADYICND